MNFYTRKIATMGLIAALVSLAGWFCVNSQGMQMPEGFSAMAMPSMSMASGDHYMYGVLHNTLSVCAFNCLNKSPEVVVAKKFSVDTDAGFLISIFDNQTPLLLADSSAPVDFSKTRPPVPDILSSVFKKE